MIISQKILFFINKWFRLPVHPFNLSNEGSKTYAQWQFERGAQTIAYYLPCAAPTDMFSGKSVLDVGCGAAGKSLYYVSQGAGRVVGIDVVEEYRGEAMALARELGLGDRFEYVCADAADTGFASGSFDTVIMNDAVEHVARPEAVLREALRLLAPGGRIFLNFPPYFHPYGAHMSDAIAVPWVHAFFSEKTLIAVYKRLVSGLPDGERRVGLRVSRRGAGGAEGADGADGGSGAGAGDAGSGNAGGESDGGGEEYISYINRMTIKRFRRILGELPAECAYYYEEPLRGFLRPLARLPVFREFLIKMVVAVLTPRAGDP